MFDIAFSEIALIAVVALVVIGPERLPKVARTLGHMFGRLQRYVNEVKADINREIELDELRKLKNEVQSAAQDIERSVSERRRKSKAACARSRRNSTRSGRRRLLRRARPAPTAGAATGKRRPRRPDATPMPRHPAIDATRSRAHLTAPAPAGAAGPSDGLTRRVTIAAATARRWPSDDRPHLQS